MTFLLVLGLSILIYLIFVIFRIGLHKRVALVLSKISLEEVQYRAAKKYGERNLFTCDVPAKWEIPELTDIVGAPEVEDHFMRGRPTRLPKGVTLPV